MDDIHKYDSIIDLPHQQSKTRLHMPLEDRAAQFAPFAALNGHSEAIRESERRTEEKPSLTEEEADALNRKTAFLCELLEEGRQPEISLSCFQPDERKSGGSCIAVSGRLRRIDPEAGTFTFADGTAVRAGDILEIQIPEKEEA